MSSRNRLAEVFSDRYHFALSLALERLVEIETEQLEAGRELHNEHALLYKWILNELEKLRELTEPQTTKGTND